MIILLPGSRSGYPLRGHWRVVVTTAGGSGRGWGGRGSIVYDEGLFVGRGGHRSRVIVKRNDNVAGQRGRRRRRWKWAGREKQKDAGIR